MNKKISLIAGVSFASIAFSGIIGADDKLRPTTPIPLLVEKSVIIVPIPRPSAISDMCTRNGFAPSLQPVVTATGEEVPNPQHCLQKDCGLGVYSMKEGETIERCSYCGASRHQQN
jgi:hypothetical protein